MPRVKGSERKQKYDEGIGKGKGKGKGNQQYDQKRGNRLREILEAKQSSAAAAALPPSTENSESEGENEYQYQYEPYPSQDLEDQMEDVRTDSVLPVALATPTEYSGTEKMEGVRTDSVLPVALATPTEYSGTEKMEGVRTDSVLPVAPATQQTLPPAPPAPATATATAPPTVPTTATDSKELPLLSNPYNLDVNNNDDSKEWEALKLLFQYGLSTVKGNRKLYESSMGSTNVQMTMAGYREPNDKATYNRMPQQYDPQDEGNDWDTFKQYYSWFTGVKMHRNDEMKLTDNEHEHVLPVGFMFLFGGGLSKQLLDTFTEKVNFPGPNPADFNGNANSVNKKMDIALKYWKMEPMTQSVGITYEKYKQSKLTIPYTSRKLNKVAVEYWKTHGKGTYTASMNDFWKTADGKELDERLKSIKETTIDQKLSDKLITDRAGQNKAIDLLKCIYNHDKAKIMEFLKNQLNLNYYGYFLSEAKANRIKSDYVFVILVKDKNNITFKVDNDAVNAFVDQIKLFFDSINEKLVKGINVTRSEDSASNVYSKNQFTGNWVSTSAGSIEMHKGFDVGKSKKIMKAVLEKLVYYLNIDIRNRIFFNIVMAPLYLEKTVEPRISKLPGTPQKFTSKEGHVSTTGDNFQSGGDGDDDKGCEYVKGWGVIDSSQYLTMKYPEMPQEEIKNKLQTALTAELEEMKEEIFDTKPEFDVKNFDVNKFVEELELNLVKITIPKQDDGIYGLEITKLLKHNYLKKNQDEEVPDDEYDVEDGTVYIPYINNRNSDIQMWDLFQWVDPINKFKDIDEPSSEDEDILKEKQEEEKKSRTAHIDFVNAYLTNNKNIHECIFKYINDPSGDKALQKRLNQLITSNAKVVGGFKNTKNASKNKKRKKTRRKKKIKRKKLTRRKHLN